MTHKIKLQFMIDPKYLLAHAEVPNAVKLKIVDPEAIFLLGILGESGRRLVKQGAPIYFTKKLADKLLKNNIAIRVK